MTLVWGRNLRTLSVFELMEPGPGVSTAPLIQNKIVFYGAGLEGTSDIVRPPIHAPVAGVYAHAMAFDNLLTYGKHYKRESPHPLVVALLSIIMVQFGLLYVGSVVQERLSGFGYRGVAFLGSVVFYGVSAFAWVSIVAVIEFEWFNLIPGEWLEIFLELVVSTHAAEILEKLRPHDNGERGAGGLDAKANVGDVSDGCPVDVDGARAVVTESDADLRMDHRQDQGPGARSLRRQGEQHR